MVLDLNINFCGSTDLAKKGADLHTPIHSPLHWISLYKRGYHLSPLGLATVNQVVLTGVKICSGFRLQQMICRLEREQGSQFF